MQIRGTNAGGLQSEKSSASVAAEGTAGETPDHAYGVSQATVLLESDLLNQESII